jgi:hypothetical protein
MDKTLIVYGYHGTSQTKAANILKHGFLASDNDYDWLGTGIYFFPTIAPTRPRSIESPSARLLLFELQYRAFVWSEFHDRKC